jgi:hydrogenase maturation protease
MNGAADGITTSIVGLGNPAMGDDGVGAEIAEILDAQVRSGQWRAPVEVINAERDPLAALHCLAEGKRVLLVDAIDMGREPGSVRAFSAQDAQPRCLRGAGSTHLLPIGQIISLASALGYAARLRMIGIQTARIGAGQPISPELRARIGAIVQTVKEEAERLP